MDGAPVSADLWRLTFEHSPVGIALVAPDGRLILVNRALCDMLGRDSGWLTERGFQEITHQEDLDADLDLVARTLTGEIDSYRLRKRYLHADGHEVWGDLSVALLREPNGEPLHFISQILDVTEQRAQEQRLQVATAEIEHEHQSLEAIFETVSVGLLLIGVDGRYERMNRRQSETMALPFPGGHHGQSGQLGQVFSLDGKTFLTQEQMPSYRAANGEEFDDYTYWVGNDPLTRAAFSVSARQVRGPSGERLGAALAYQEITPVMRALQVRDDFVSSVSHELRTPLTSVLGHLEMLEERDDLPGDVPDSVRIIQRNALRLQALVNDLLHVAQAAEGAIHLHRSPVDLAMLVRDAVEAGRPVAARVGVSVEVDVPVRMAAKVDEQRIRQVLDNLLSNAIKYTPSGGTATVVLTQRPDAIEIAVSDTGVGIAADDVERVFTRFFRCEQAVTNYVPGTGLGLHIVSSIVVAHGGTVTLDSEPDRGSTFTVTLPALTG